MFNLIFEMLSYPFLSRAIIAGSLIALCAAMLGVSLVLKRYSMIGDGLSHVGFGALSVAMVFNVAPLLISIPIVIVAAFFLLRLSTKSKIKGDSAIALVSCCALAIGVTVVFLFKGVNIDVYNYLFGSILALSHFEVIISIVLAIIVILIYVIFYNKIFAVTIDEDFFNTISKHSKKYNILLAILTAVTVVIGMKIMGTMLISGLIVFPCLTSLRVFITYKQVIISSAVISVICFIVGIVISYAFNLPTGASIVLTNLASFILFSIVKLFKSKVSF